MKKLTPYSQLKTKPTKLSDFFKTERRWCKIFYGRDNNGSALSSQEVRRLGNDRVSRCCLNGALILRSESVLNNKDEKILAKIIKEKYPNNYSNHDFSTIVAFNDNPDTNFEMIKEVVAEFDKVAV